MFVCIGLGSLLAAESPTLSTRFALVLLTATGVYGGAVTTAATSIDYHRMKNVGNRKSTFLLIPASSGHRLLLLLLRKLKARIFHNFSTGCCNAVLGELSLSHVLSSAEWWAIAEAYIRKTKIKPNRKPCCHPSPREGW